MLDYRLNVPTSFDFLLFFAHAFFPEHSANRLILHSLPWLYTCAINYNLSRNRNPSQIALAALCHTLQLLDGFKENPESRDTLLESLSVNAELIQGAEELLWEFAQ